ncbi:MAG: cyclin-domain-containing protein [Benjaminiella poitrasii]|nr:MAG: cyclin-domain-containing protein [Benjaminiella poitrasii]
MSYPILTSAKSSQISELVVQMVPKIWTGNITFLSANYSSAFRFYCQNIFKTTQISNACVLVALFYIYRLRYSYPSIQASMGSEVRLFTTALILANKYMDDNTFTNKTWSEVSGIPLKELNIMEREFLAALQYKICIHHTQFFTWTVQCQHFLTQFLVAPALLESVVASSITPICTSSKMRQTNKRSADHFPVDDTVISLKRRSMAPSASLNSLYNYQRTATMWNPILSWSSSASVSTSNHPAAASVATAAAASAMNVNYSNFIPRVYPQ